MENVVFPMQVGIGQSWLRAEKPVSGRFRFLLTFRTGERVRFPEYGTRMEDLEQATDEIEILGPQNLILLQNAALQFISDIRLLGVTLDRLTIPERKLIYSVIFEVPGEREVRRESYQTDLRFRA
jgi:hypothetical protein